MVFFALTRQGFDTYRSITIKQEQSTSLWVAAGVITEEELKPLRVNGVDVTVFNYEIARADSASIQDAVETIKEHHPNACIWVEA